MRTVIIAFVAGAAVGGAGGYALSAWRGAPVPGPAAAVGAPSSALQVRLYRFDVNPDGQAELDEWMNFLRARRPEVLATLGREKMYVEAIFRGEGDQASKVYWVTVQGEGGASVDDSPHEVDRKHNEYFRRVIAKGSRLTMEGDPWFVAPFLTDAIAARGHDAP
jgi:Family of unknown function (DUF6176)